MLTVDNTFWALKTEARNERIKQESLTSGLYNQCGQTACCRWCMFKGCVYHYVRVWESWSLFYFFYRLDLNTIIWIQVWRGKQAQAEIYCVQLLSYTNGGGRSLHSRCPPDSFSKCAWAEREHFPVPTGLISYVSVCGVQVLGLCHSVSQLQLINSWGVGLVFDLNQC